MVFGDVNTLDEAAVRAIVARFPDAQIVGCTTAGAFAGARLLENELAITAITFDKARVRIAMSDFCVDGVSCEKLAAARVGRELAAPDLKHVFVLSEGLGINGSALVAGLRSELGTIEISGGLAGDGERMETTAILAGGKLRSRALVAIGFYGPIIASIGCVSGWLPFGPERLITRSEGNVLFELDGRPALDLYMKYLGDEAVALPASGLFFPMEIRAPTGDAAVVRTLLGIDPERRSVRFAGDMPEGHFARLMTASRTQLIDGSRRAGVASVHPQNQLALAVSCVGRRMVLGKRAGDEIASLLSALGDVPLTGFYSYGEIAPRGFEPCALHNQTMTVTSISEAA